MPGKFGKYRSGKGRPETLVCETCGKNFPKTSMHIGPGGKDECTDCRHTRTGGVDSWKERIQKARDRQRWIAQGRKPTADTELEAEAADLMERSKG